MNLSWMPRFLANSFLGLNDDFSIQIDFSKKIHFVYSKLILRPKNCLLEIGVSNLEGPFIYNQTSTVYRVKHTERN